MMTIIKCTWYTNVSARLDDLVVRRETDSSRLQRVTFNRQCVGGLLEAISNQIKIYIVMSFFCAAQAVKYLHHTQFYLRQQYAN